MGAPRVTRPQVSPTLGLTMRHRSTVLSCFEGDHHVLGLGRKACAKHGAKVRRRVASDPAAPSKACTGPTGRTPDTIVQGFPWFCSRLAHQEASGSMGKGRYITLNWLACLNTSRLYPLSCAPLGCPVHGTHVIDPYAQAGSAGRNRKQHNDSHTKTPGADCGKADGTSWC